MAANKKASINTRGIPVNDVVRAYLDQVSKNPLLTHAEELALARTIRDGNPMEAKAATKRFIECNLRLVAALAFGYAKVIKKMAVEDMIQEGNIGLMTAVRKFDPERGFKFSTYASWWIRQAILRASYANHLIRVPIYQLEKQNQIRKMVRMLTLKYGRPPTASEVATEVDMEVEEIEWLLGINNEAVSLDAPLREDDEGSAALIDCMADDTTLNPEQQALMKDLEETVKEYLRSRLEDDRVSERDLDVVIMRFNMDGSDMSSLEDIGERVGLTRERVRQILFRQINLMRPTLQRMFAERRK